MELQHQLQEMYPKFVIAWAGSEQEYVIHLHTPRFIAEVVEVDDETFELVPIFIDDPEVYFSSNPIQREHQMEKLIAVAEAWYVSQYEEDEGEDTFDND